MELGGGGSEAEGIERDEDGARARTGNVFIGLSSDTRDPFESLEPSGPSKLSSKEKDIILGIGKSRHATW